MLEKTLTILKETVVVNQILDHSHAGTVWDGALVLALYLQKQFLLGMGEDNGGIAGELVKDKKIIELGSGTGIAGLALVPFRPRQLILTDMPEYIPFLQGNIAKNQQLIAKYSQQSDQLVRGEALSWGELTQHEVNYKDDKIDTIMGSEVAYSASCITELIKTLVWFKTHHNPHIKMLFSYQKYEGTRNLLTRLLSYQGEQCCFVRKGHPPIQNKVNLVIEEVDEQEMDEECRDSYYGILIIR